jgi:hypothetical protein
MSRLGSGNLPTLWIESDGSGPQLAQSKRHDIGCLAHGRPWIAGALSEKAWIWISKRVIRNAAKHTQDRIPAHIYDGRMSLVRLYAEAVKATYLWPRVVLEGRMADLSLSFTELTQLVQESSKTISEYLQKHSLPEPTLKADAFPFFPGTGAPDVDPYPRIPEDVRKARLQLQEAAYNLAQMASGPTDAIFELMIGHYAMVSMQFVYHYRICELVPVRGDISYRELAEKAGVLENQCTRVVKHLITRNFLCQPRPGHVAHTALSMMARVPELRDGMGYLTEESFPGAPHIVEASKRFQGSQEKNETSCQYTMPLKNLLISRILACRRYS